MKLHEFKSQSIILLSQYKPRNEVEREAKQHIINRIRSLRYRWLGSLISEIATYLDSESVCSEFKETLVKILELASKLVEAKIRERLGESNEG